MPELQPKQIDLLDGYISFVADIEQSQPYVPRGDRELTLPEQASIAIGAGCVQAVKGHDERATALFREAQHILTPYALARESNTIRWNNYNGVLFYTLAGMLALRNTDKAVRSLYDRLQQEATAALIGSNNHAMHMQRIEFKTNDPQAKKAGQRARGQVAELTALKLGSRHPQILSLLALDHHDRSRRAYNNFDQVLIEPTPREVEDSRRAHIGALAHKVQVKAPCLGYCNLDKPTAKVQQSYAPDIALISGGCDLRMRRNNGRWRFPLTTLLIREAQGRTAEEDTAALDTATNWLLLATTTGEGRKGHYIDKLAPIERVRSASARVAAGVK